MLLDFKIDASGPVFDGEIPGIMRAYEYHITKVLGDMAVNIIKDYLPTQFKYQRGPFLPGLYLSDIHTDRQSADVNLVHDTPVVYGPWLEGVGSQNPIVWPHHRDPPPRRFPGYAAFRRAAQQLDRAATDIANVEIQPYIQEMNA